ncbi:response regulator [Geotoga petraea]|nr:response regulator [Geotoga petraea]SDC25698.1 Response regulator receiver domain-containing protein [Geotoga petraea]
MKKILIADDTKNIRNLLVLGMKNKGYDVEEAIDGEEALRKINHNKYDLIFLDIKMPKISGTKILKEMRNKDDHTDVVIMTAYGTVKNAIECTKLGTVAYIQKPFTFERLENTLKNMETAKINSYYSNEEFTKIKDMFSINPIDPEIYRKLGDFIGGKKGEIYKEFFHKVAEKLDNLTNQKLED